jgi:hypothetical protein
MEERERPSKASPTVITTPGSHWCMLRVLDMASRALIEPLPHGRREGQGRGTVSEPVDSARSPSSERTRRQGGRRRRRPPPSTTDLFLVLADASLGLEDGGERAEKRKWRRGGRPWPRDGRHYFSPSPTDAGTGAPPAAACVL